MIKHKTKRILLGLLATVFALGSLATFMPKSSALSGSDFKAGNIIDDALFFDGDTMTVTEIQNFLNAKVPTCDTNHAYSGSANDSGAPYTCLKDYRQNIPAKSAEDSLCNGTTAASNQTAAQIIDKVAASCGVSEKVLIVLLQKEQSLVTDVWPWDIQYTKATGYGCPDSDLPSNVDSNNNGCYDQYEGFFNQVYYAARIYKYYAKYPNSYNHVPGRYNNILWHPNSACGSSSVFIQNQATAGLYNYTPYRPNNAALNNLYGTGDSCSTYGNRNFWRIYNDWFGSTTRSVLFKVSGSATYYLEWGTYYYPIPTGEILEAYGLASIAPRTISSFPSGKTRGPLLERAAKFGSDDPDDPNFTAAIYLVDGGKKHGAPNWYTLGLHGVGSYTNYDITLVSLLSSGDPLRPVVRRPNGAMYVLDANKRRGFPDSETFYNLSGPDHTGANKAYSSQSFTNMSDTYILSKIAGAPMLLDGKFFKLSGTSAIYLHDGGKKYLFDVTSYAAWGAKNDYSFSSSSVDQITYGGKAPLFIKSSWNGYYLVDGGNKKVYGASGMTAWGLEDSDYTLLSDRAVNRLGSGSKVSQLITDHRPGIYYVEGGKRHGIPSMSDFSRLGFSWSKVDSVSQTALSILPRGADLYAPGALVRTPNGAVFMLDVNYVARGVNTPALFVRFGFNWNQVKNVTAKGLDGYTFESLRTLLRDSSDNKFYLVENGVYHYMDSSAMGASQYDFGSLPNNSVDSKVFDTLTKGKQLTRFIRGSGPTVYYIENGKRRAITTEAKFYQLGGSWAQVINVSDEFLGEISRGTNI